MTPTTRWAATALTIALAIALPHTATASEQKPADAPKTLESNEQKMSYVMGLQIGASLAEMGIQIDIQALARGLSTSLEGSARLLTADEEEVVRQEIALQAQRHQAREHQSQAVRNRQSGLTFLTQNKLQEGVVTTESGLQYIVIEPGDGPKPTANNRVRVHYRGTLIDGTEFDSSYRRGEPAVFPVHAVIPGWTEALQLMSPGSKYQLFIPPDLAYGERGAGKTIGPNATLIFEVELIGIE